MEDIQKKTTEEYLLENYREEVPQWLRDYRPGQERKVTFREVLSSHVLYYPGSGFDGEPVRIFNRSHSAHVFLYVDYGVSREQLDAELAESYFTGYHHLDRIEFTAAEIADTNVVPPVCVSKDVWKSMSLRDFKTKPFCFMEIMERDADRFDDWGAERLAVIFLYADGIASYVALFCGGKYPVPFAVLLLDHGFGGNYDRFGGGGLLEDCAVKTGALPELLLVACNLSRAWLGYRQIEGLEYARAGYPVAWKVGGKKYRRPHALFKRD